MAAVSFFDALGCWQIFTQLEALLTPTSNHEPYRQEVAAAMLAGKPCMPYLGLYLKDIMSVHNCYEVCGALAPTEKRQPLGEADTSWLLLQTRQEGGAGVGVTKLLALHKLLQNFSDAHVRRTRLKRAEG